MLEDTPAAPLRNLLLAIDETLVELSDEGAGTHIRSIAVFGPDEEQDQCPGALALVIGARGRRAVRYVRAAARAGAAAVAVKTAGDDDDLFAAARNSEIVCVAVRPQTRWEQLLVLLREALDSAALTTDQNSEHGDLFALAQTVATLTAGNVTIEDAGNRVLAYSRSDGDIDELRRRSILGWEGPQQYLALLRQWGVFQKLRSSERVVHVEERPELGIRHRLAIGINAGTHHLGAIWVQEGEQPLADRAEDILLGAARVSAVHLIRRRGSSYARPQADLLAGLLDKRLSPDLGAGRLGLDPTASTIVLAFDPQGAEHDRSELELHQLEIANVVAVQAASYRREALVGRIGRRIYALIPDVPETRAESALIVLAEDIAAALERRRMPVYVGIGSPVPTLGQAPMSRSEADRVLDALARQPSRTVAQFADLRAEVLLNAILELFEENPELRDPGIAALTEHDETHGTQLVKSLRTYLNVLGDFTAAADRLHVHTNTVRNRVRRATTVGALELADPHERLCCHLELLLADRIRPNP